MYSIDFRFCNDVAVLPFDSAQGTAMQLLSMVIERSRNRAKQDTKVELATIKKEIVKCKTIKYL